MKSAFPSPNRQTAFNKSNSAAPKPPRTHRKMRFPFETTTNNPISRFYNCQIRRRIGVPRILPPQPAEPVRQTRVQCLTFGPEQVLEARSRTLADPASVRSHKIYFSLIFETCLRTVSQRHSNLIPFLHEAVTKVHLLSHSNLRVLIPDQGNFDIFHDIVSHFSSPNDPRFSSNSRNHIS